MRRIKLVLAMAAVLVGMLALQAGPAMADDCDFRERGDRDDVVVCHDDGDREVFYADDFDDGYYYDYAYFDDFYFFSPYYFSPYYFGYYDYGCEGPVCLID